MLHARQVSGAGLFASSRYFHSRFVFVFWFITLLRYYYYIKASVVRIFSSLRDMFFRSIIMSTHNIINASYNTHLAAWIIMLPVFSLRVFVISTNGIFDEWMYYCASPFWRAIRSVCSWYVLIDKDRDIYAVICFIINTSTVPLGVGNA